ncbi:FUSC family protein [Cellulomonas sp. NPDC089187]|uniref:FUSC family protein n=1 Tax=Cellulomonas sp. NPDC089187 TaxID=3154970 RepID=UPI0034403C3A
MPHRLTLLRDLTHPDQFRAAMRPNRASGTLGGALRCGITVTIAFLVVAAAGHSELAGFASLGALASLYGRDEVYPWRWRLMALAGGSLTASVAVCAGLSAMEAPTVVLLIAIGVIASLATAACALLRSGPPGGTIIIFAAGAGMSPVTGDAATVVGERTLVTLVGAVIAVLVCNAGVVWQLARRLPLGSAPRIRDLVRPDAAVRSSALIVLGASLAAGAVATLAGWGHPAWAAMGATAVLHGRDVHHMGQRAIQRALGTVGGAAIAVPLLAAHLPFWAVATLVVVLQTVTEVIVARHYGLAMLTITPMALLMTSIGGSADPVGMAVDRGLDTLVGALIGVLAAVIAARPGAPATEAGEPASEQGRSASEAEVVVIQAVPEDDDPASLRAPAPPASR